MKNFQIKENIIRQEISSRGGGIEISLDNFKNRYSGVKMTAYQNYLGGGMLGSVGSDCNIRRWKEDKTLVELSEKLKRYFHELTNPCGEWEKTSYEQNQKMSSSAY